MLPVCIHQLRTALAEQYRDSKREIMAECDRSWQSLEMAWFKDALSMNVALMDNMYYIFDRYIIYMPIKRNIHRKSIFESRWFRHRKCIKILQKLQFIFALFIHSSFSNSPILLFSPTSGEDVRLCQAASASDHQGWNGERPLREEIYLFLVIWEICGF